MAKRKRKRPRDRVAKSTPPEVNAEVEALPAVEGMPSLASTPPFEEHRHEQRAPITVEISLESEHNFYAGVTDNVSTGGVFLATVAHPPTGATVELDLGLEDDLNRYHLRGVVSWVRDVSRATDFAPAGCGIRWLDLPAPAEQAIRAFVDRRDTILYDDD